MCCGWEITWLISIFLGWFSFKRWHFLCLWTWTCNAQLAVLFLADFSKLGHKPFWSYYYLKTLKFKVKLAMFLIEPLYKVFTRLWSRLFKIQNHHISWSSKCSELLWQKACRGTRGENSWKYHWSVKCPNTWSCFSLQQERKLKKDRNCKSSLQKKRVEPKNNDEK